MDLPKNSISTPFGSVEQTWFRLVLSVSESITQTSRDSQSRYPAGEIADDSAHCRIPSGSACGIGRSRARSSSVQHPHLWRVVRKTDFAPSFRYARGM